MPGTSDVHGSTPMDVEQILKETPLFSQVQKKDIKRLAASLTQRSYSAGEVIIQEGKPGVGLFVLARGSVTASANGKVIRTMGAGEHFGEVALIDDGPRTAQITADTDVDCFVLPAWEFRAIVRDHPDVSWALLRSLVFRIVRDAEAPDQL